MKSSFFCRIGLHRFVDFPDPNPEAGGLESQGYKACTSCSKEKDETFYARRGPIRDKFPR